MSAIVSIAESSFFFPDVLRAVNDLPLQVGEIDDIEIHEADSANSGRSQIKTERRAESARADQQNARLLQLQLTFHAHFGHDEVAAVTEDFVLRKTYFFRHVNPPAMLGTMESVSGVAHRSRILFHVADVFVIQIDIDEAAQLAFIVVEMFLQFGKTRRERSQHFTDGLSGQVRRYPCLSANCRSGVGIRIRAISVPLSLRGSAPHWAASCWRGRSVRSESESTTNEYHGQEFFKSVSEKYAPQSGCEW